MSLFAEQNAFAYDLVKLLSKAWGLGYLVSVREVARTPEQQRLYVQQGRSKTMNSNHLRATAADVYFQQAGKLLDRTKLEELGRYWESLNPKNRWGGFWKFKDEPHFERTP